MSNDPNFYAHSENPIGVKHLLRDHLLSVSSLASEFLQGLPWQEDARLAGLLHDLGKYGDLFQRRLQGQEQGLDHWSSGAWVALKDFRSVLGALAVQGHHIGLQSGFKANLERLEPGKLAASPGAHGRPTGDLDTLKTRWKAEVDAVAPSHSGQMCPVMGPELMLEARLVFSALADVDFLDTEAHFKGEAAGKRYRARGPALEPEIALGLVQRHLATLAAGSTASPMLRQVRQTLLRDALKSAQQDTGLFTFTAPTGSGKTLAMLAFALAHAAKHGLRRVILAVPYLSILEQTAEVYREVLSSMGKDYILEHHSLAGLGRGGEELEQERLRRLFSENWDAPLVLTTNVQILESLFSDRPSACRKLHRLAHSVILFDEAQTLPLNLAVPTLAALSQLASKTGASLVFATATQPAYPALGRQVREAGGVGWEPREAVPSASALFAASRRVTPAWELAKGVWDMERLAQELRGQNRALCIFNLKRQALELTRLLAGQEGLFHLSTNLCPAHRRDVLLQVRERLRSGAPCRLVATQCVEAGVDLDFPVVYRALGPLEAVAQAAGRCNREGRSEKGRLVVFEMGASDYPDTTYRQAAMVAKALLQERHWCLDLDDPQTYQDYYRRLFDLTRPEARSPELAEGIGSGNFVQVAQQYRLIKQDAINVLVPYQGAWGDYQKLLREEAEDGIRTDWMRRAQLLAVVCYRPGQQHPAWGVLKPAHLSFKRMESDEWFLINEALPGWSYEAETGLNLPEKQGAWPVMIA